MPAVLTPVLQRYKEKLYFQGFLNAASLGILDPGTHKVRLYLKQTKTEEGNQHSGWVMASIYYPSPGRLKQEDFKESDARAAYYVVQASLSYSVCETQSQKTKCRASKMAQQEKTLGAKNSQGGVVTLTSYPSPLTY